MPRVDIELEDNKQFISNIPRTNILHDTGLEFYQAIVSSIKHIEHRYILTGKIHPTRDGLVYAVHV